MTPKQERLYRDEVERVNLRGIVSDLKINPISALGHVLAELDRVRKIGLEEHDRWYARVEKAEARLARLREAAQAAHDGKTWSMDRLGEVLADLDRESA